MTTLVEVPGSVKFFRWTARIWSLLVIGTTILRLITPDPSSGADVPIEDWFLLSLWGVAILGLLVAWRWELAGALITIGTMFFRELMWVILKGAWMVGFLMIWIFIVPPAILFLIAWMLQKRAEEI